MSSILSRTFRFVQEHYALIICAFIFSVLLFRNPFSLRTVIPNLEPYPDSLYYITPALSMVKGTGFQMYREGRSFRQAVPILYSASLLPLFLIHQDARMFYVTNVVLCFFSLFLFYLVIRKLTKEGSIQFLSLFLFSTNLLISWYAQRPMAENLILPLFILSVFLILSRATTRRVILIFLVSIAFYESKYAALPVAITTIMAYALKLFLERKKYTNLLRIYVSVIIAGFVLYIGYQYLFLGQNMISLFINLIINNYFRPVHNVPDSSFFSLRYVHRNLPMYLGWLTGHPLIVLWKEFLILPSFLSICACIGLISGLFRKQTRLLCISIITMLSGSILFLSTFYVVDGRYLYQAVPAMIIGLAVGLDTLSKGTGKKCILFFSTVLFLVYILTSIKPLEAQAMLNIRHSETPWYYISVTTLDSFIQSLLKSDKEPIVISALPPYFVDYYSHRSFTLLPLHKDQEFRGAREATWGNYDFNNLISVYSDFLSKGYSVYLESYGLGNETYLHQAFDRIITQFHAIKVANGCVDVCNIYKLIASTDSGKLKTKTMQVQ